MTNKIIGTLAIVIILIVVFGLLNEHRIKEVHLTSCKEGIHAYGYYAKYSGNFKITQCCYCGSEFITLISIGEVK